MSSREYEIEFIKDHMDDLTKNQKIKLCMELLDNNYSIDDMVEKNNGIYLKLKTLTDNHISVIYTSVKLSTEENISKVKNKCENLVK